MVQRKMLSPTPSDVTSLPGAEGVTTEEGPDRTVHDPVPVEGMLPLSVKSETQTVALLPASEGEGKSSRLMTTVDVLGGQTPFVRVHTKLLTPVDRPVAMVLKVPEEERLAGPV